jgi:hypothetical protein
VSLADATRDALKWVNDAARFVISRRVASQMDLPHWAGDESMKWMSKNEYDLFDKAGGRTVEVRDVRANTGGTLHSPTLKCKEEKSLAAGLKPRKGYQNPGHN